MYIKEERKTVEEGVMAPSSARKREQRKQRVTKDDELSILKRSQRASSRVVSCLGKKLLEMFERLLSNLRVYHVVRNMLTLAL